MSQRGPVVFANDELIELLGRDPELLAIADAISETRPRIGRRRVPRRAWLVAAAILAVLLLAIPAIAALTHVIDFGSSPRAPGRPAVMFGDLDKQAPPGMAPGAIPSETRALTLPFGVKQIVVYIAPTKQGGYCHQFAHPGAAGCDRSREIPFAPGLAWDRTDEPGLAYAFALNPDATAVRLTVPGQVSSMHQLTWISAPIDAGVVAIPIGPMTRTPTVQLDLLDEKGQVIDTWKVRTGSPG